jgi:hypothetical protein
MNPIQAIKKMPLKKAGIVGDPNASRHCFLLGRLPHAQYEPFALTLKLL